MNQRIMPILVALAGIVVSIFIMLQVIFNPTGGLAGILKYAAVPLIAICFLTPKTGLIILCWVSFYADYYKKLAVYYGTSSMMTVMEVLALSMAMVGAIIGGSVSQALIRGPVPDKTSRNLFLITMVITGLFLASGGDGMSGKVQNAVNSGLYLGLAAVICYHLQDRESALKLCRLQFWLGVPWVIWAARQYFYGFTEMEWFYARKGFSPVLAGQMLGMEIPRPYGFGGSSSAYGVITYLFMFGVWHAMRFEKKRPFYWAGALVFAGGLFVSMQRTILILPILTFGAYLLFRTPGGVKFFYASVVVALVSGILASDLLLGGLGEANEKIRVEGTGWASKVVQVGTFADRLKGWTRLKKAKSYSLFGTGSGEITSFDSDDYSHDVINRILIHYGLVGLGVTFGLLIWTARRVHGMVFKIRDPVDRDTLVFV
ncbi:MAG TPA: hypothetical protein VK956_04380, partial [Verrucomicrobium sp.]|nr:hypothetical protein [Verrucomicrobium sp.]